MKGWVKVVVFLLLPVTGFLLLLGGVFTDKVNPGQTALKAPSISGVKVAKIENSRYQAGLKVSGTVVSQEDATIASKLMASVQKMVVTKGTHVKQGDPLVILDPSQVSAQAKQAQTGISVAQSAQESVNAATQYAQSGVEQEGTMVQQARTGVQDAQARFTNAKDRYERMKNLYENQAVSKQDYDDSQTNYLTAKAALEKAQANLNSSQASLKQAQDNVNVAAAKSGEVQAQVAQAQAGYEAATVLVSDSTIRAPFDGILIDTLVHEGDMASPGLPILKMEKAPYYLETYLDEGKLQNIHQGESVPVYFSSSNLSVTGAISEITPHVDPQSRKFKVKILLPASPSIISGLYGEATFPDGGESSIFIPQSAIVRWSQFTGVYVVDEKNIAHLRFVNLGRTQGNQIEVLSGINMGEWIVMDSVDKVTDKAKVVATP